MHRQNSFIMHTIRGRIGDLVIRQYAHGPVISRMPDMSRIIPTEAQVQRRSRFKEAVAYARQVLADPGRKAALQATLEPGTLAYHALIREYLGSGTED